MFFKIPPAGRTLPHCCELSLCLRPQRSISGPFDRSMSDVELGKVAVETECLQKPKNHDNHYDGIQDLLDLTLHGDVTVNKP
jgi:hypothetical protein